MEIDSEHRHVSRRNVVRRIYRMHGVGYKKSTIGVHIKHVHAQKAYLDITPGAPRRHHWPRRDPWLLVSLPVDAPFLGLSRSLSTC